MGAEATISPADLRRCAAPSVHAARAVGVRRALCVLGESGQLDKAGRETPGAAPPPAAAAAAAAASAPRAHSGNGVPGGGATAATRGDGAAVCNAAPALPSRQEKFKRNRLRSLIQARCRRNLTLALCRWWVFACVVAERGCRTPSPACDHTGTSAAVTVAAAGEGDDTDDDDSPAAQMDMMVSSDSDSDSDDRHDRAGAAVRVTTAADDKKARLLMFAMPH